MADRVVASPSDSSSYLRLSRLALDSCWGLHFTHNYVVTTLHEADHGTRFSLRERRERLISRSA